MTSPPVITSIVVPNAVGNTLVHSVNKSKITSKTHLLRNPSLTTPVRVLKLRNFLQGYDKNITKFSVEGFSQGFSLGFQGNLITSIAKNHRSVLENEDLVSEKINSECSLGRISGPFSSPQFENYKISPLGLVPKKDGGFRIIHDLSFPKHGDSVNSAIPKSFTEVQYETLDIVISEVLFYGRGSLIAKADIENAFRIIPVHHNDWPLLGFQWNNQFYYDKCLPMGCSASCKIVETLAQPYSGF